MSVGVTLSSRCIFSKSPQFSVYRVSWLRAKARKDRWWEEITIVSHEMLFVILSHVREANTWRERARESGGLEGRRAFAHRMMLVAERRADDARKGFSGKVVDVNWEED